MLQDQVPGEIGQADRDEVRYLRPGVCCLRETVPFLSHRALHPDPDPELGCVAQQPQGGRTSELGDDLDHWSGRLTPGPYGSDNLLFWLVAKIPRDEWDECRATAEGKARNLPYDDLSVLLLQLALEKEKTSI